MSCVGRHQSKDRAAADAQLIQNNHTSISNATRNNISPIRWAYNLYLLSNNSELAPDKKMITT